MPLSISAFFRGAPGTVQRAKSRIWNATYSSLSSVSPTDWHHARYVFSSTFSPWLIGNSLTLRTGWAKGASDPTSESTASASKEDR